MVKLLGYWIILVLVAIVEAQDLEEVETGGDLTEDKCNQSVSWIWKS